MSAYSSNIIHTLQRLVASLSIVALLLTAVPAPFVYAQEAPPETNSADSGTASSTDTTGGVGDQSSGAAGDGTDGSSGESTDGTSGAADGTDGTDGNATSSDNGTSGPDGQTGTSTEQTATSSDPAAEGNTTDSGTDGTDGSLDAGAGTDGTSGNDTGTSTNPCGEGVPDCTGTSTDQTGSGTEGGDGSSGSDGSGGNAGEEAGDPVDPVTVFSENDLGNNDNAPEDVTGNVDVHQSRSATVITGEATAQGQLFSDVNSGDIRSEVDETTIGDLDFYTFSATGTNDADVNNTAAILADTGNNTADSSGPSLVHTGDAFAAVNIANIVNTNVVNSDGFLYLKNQMLQSNQSLDLSDFFFPDPDSVLAAASTCNLNSCIAEDIEYNLSQTNTALVSNNAAVEALSGANFADGEFADIVTGDAYGGANVINVVNTNVIDSNYRFLTFNAMGDLDGDLVLPDQNLFTAFYSRPNGMTQVEQGEAININALSVNGGVINDNLNTLAESGQNLSTTLTPGDITTGNAEAESNILNRVNQTIYGGDSMYLLIRVHGSWTGDVKGLPAGLDYMWTSEGVLIYNPNGEIAPSPLIRDQYGRPYDVDSYTANLQNFNTADIDNNITIRAISGENEITGSAGSITTGDAVASANVLNLANTDIIGTNFALAVINIFGDFAGDVTFTETDLSLTGSVDAPDPLGPGDALAYTYTVHNNSTAPATNVVLRQVLQNATVDGSNTEQSTNLGTLNPGDSSVVSFSAAVNPDIPSGTTSVRAVATVESDAGDTNFSDNAVLLSLIAEYTDGGTGDGGSGTTTDDGTGTTTDDGSGTSGDGGTDDSNTQSNTSGGSSGGGGGGGGGGSKSKTKSIERELKAVDPTSAPLLVLQKTADIDEDDVVAAGDPVDYLITVTNKGGNAYDAILYDTLTNPIGSVLNEDSWDLGTILAGEIIEVEYTTTYNLQTPSGNYTNTASIEAYRHEDSKETGDDPLKLDTVEHIIEISGVPLAVGNVQPLAYFPTPNGDVGALVVWETSKPAQSQIFYSPKMLVSPFNRFLPNFGYQNASFKFPDERTTHAMILYGLQRGTTYAFKIHAHTDEHTAFGGDYTLTIPSVLASLTLANQPQSQVAGAATTVPTPVVPYQPPTYPAAAASAPGPAPTPEPEPVTEPEPEPEPKPAGVVGGFVNKVFGFFR